jgi:hypothetical protein
MELITVAFTVSCRRPRYLRRTVESWARCRGEARYLFSLEPPGREFGIGEFIQWAHHMLGDVEIITRPQPLGCSDNTFHALRDGFKKSDFVVLAEEDIEVADDTLEYFTWASGAYRDSSQVLAVCAHVKGASETATESGVSRAPWFSPLVWGTWRDRWEGLLAPDWREPEGGGWDGYVRKLNAERSMECVFPHLSRALHFGESSTLTPRTAGGGPNYYHRTALSQCFSPAYGSQDYQESVIPFGMELY